MKASIPRYRLLFVLVSLLTFPSAYGQVIVIDPGHGYSASGGNPDGRSDIEHSTALAVGLKLRDQVRKSCEGWTAHMTRTTRNGWISLSQRRAMSNSWQADRFISIHCNAGGGTGTETFWCNRSNSADAHNRAFSREVQDRMVEQGQWKDRRSVEDGTYIFHLGVLRSNNAIGILNEIGFVDSGDKSKLLSDHWRDKFAAAYLSGLQNSLNSACSPPQPGDTQPPTTTVSAVGGNTQYGDFTVSFSDQDNVGVTRRYYQALENYGGTWYANRRKGFFNDNFKEMHSGYSYGEGDWQVRDGHLYQASTSSTNTAISSYVSQGSGLPYLYAFSAKVLSTSGPRKFGLHIMADDTQQSQRGNSYLIWFSGQDNKVRIYETVDNVLNTRATSDVPLDNLWASYKVTYSPAYGVIEVFRNNKSVLRWVDPSPIREGSGISLRTNATRAEFDDLKVYKFRAEDRKTITAGTATTKDIRTARGRVKSLVRDAAGNWSAPGSLDVQLVFGTDRSSSRGQSISLSENPSDGQHLILEYDALRAGETIIRLTDHSGRSLKEIRDPAPGAGKRSVDISPLLLGAKSGHYLIYLRHAGDVQVLRVVKK